MIDIIEPSAEVLPDFPTWKEKIEVCARVCYKTEDRIGPGTAEKMVQMLIDRGHTAMLEHFRFVVPCYINGVQVTTAPGVEYQGGGLFDVNIRNLIDIGFSLDSINSIIADSQPSTYKTVRFVCDRGISHELVRHRVFSFAQESTRYCDYTGKMQFIRPCFFDVEAVRYGIWRKLCCQSANAYQVLRANGASPQEARDVLPTSVKTEVLMTGTRNMWKGFWYLRYHESTGKVHPQMEQLVNLLADQPGWLEYMGER